MQEQLNSDNIQFGIVGLGLIGGSIAKSLKANNFDVYADDANQSNILSALNDKVILGTLDEMDSSKAFALIFCVPVSAHKEVFKQHGDLINRAKLVTDCSSVKDSVLKDLKNNNFIKKNYVFSHPMAGSEKSGYLNASEKLFQNKSCLLMTTAETEPASLEICIGLWETLGSDISYLDLKDHDLILAMTSHLPHLISFALVSTLSESEINANKIFSGGGLKDFTRIASSDVKMWKDIFIYNNENILLALDKFIERISVLKNFIKDNDSEQLEMFIEEAKNFRDSNL